MSDNADRLKELVELHARQLGEHVDTVQIFVTKQVDGGETTRSYEFGTGNIHARFGQVSIWTKIQKEYAKEWARIEQRKDLE